VSKDEQPASPEVQNVETQEIKPAVSLEPSGEEVPILDLPTPDFKWLPKSESPNHQNDSLTARMYYSLAEATEQMKCAPSDLLHFGSRGQLAFFVSVPSDVDVYPTDLLGGVVETPIAPAR
jgi:hypothetical protein